LRKSTIRTQSLLYISAGFGQFDWPRSGSSTVHTKIELFQDDAFPSQMLNTVAIFQLLLQTVE